MLRNLVGYYNDLKKFLYALQPSPLSSHFLPLPFGGEADE
jgi:hypothetical protein